MHDTAWATTSNATLHCVRQLFKLRNHFEWEKIRSIVTFRLVIMKITMSTTGLVWLSPMFFPCHSLAVFISLWVCAQKTESPGMLYQDSSLSINNTSMCSRFTRAVSKIYFYKEDKKVTQCQSHINKAFNSSGLTGLNSMHIKCKHTDLQLSIKCFQIRWNRVKVE